MKIKAWMQIGVERRETVIEIPDEEYRRGQRVAPCMEAWLEEIVFQWLECQYGWGWSGAGQQNDYGALEGSEALAGLCVVANSAANTRAIRLDQ